MLENSLVAGFSDHLGGWMRQGGMTQAELSRRAAVPQPMISRILSGKWKNLTLETISKVAAAFGIFPELRFHPIATSINRKPAPVPRSAACFWDVDPRDVHLPEHAFFAAERILSYGSKKEIRWLFRNVGRDTIASVIKESRNIPPKSAVFWSRLFNIPAEQIRCLKKS